MVELMVQIPDDLAQRLQPVQDRLTEIIEVGLREIARTQSGLHSEVIEFLASGPDPQTIINYRPSPEAQARVTALLNKNRTGILSSDEQAELDQYENLDYLMTLVKTQARRRQSLAL